MKLSLMRLLCLIAVLLWLCFMGFRIFSAAGNSASAIQQQPPLRIVCYGSEKMMRCPSQCVVSELGQADCRCQDFYYQRGDEPLSFSHSLCR